MPENGVPEVVCAFPVLQWKCASGNALYRHRPFTNTPLYRYLTTSRKAQRLLLLQLFSSVVWRRVRRFIAPTNTAINVNIGNFNWSGHGTGVFWRIRAADVISGDFRIYTAKWRITPSVYHFMANTYKCGCHVSTYMHTP